jgi:phosphatidylglycerophosphate synthase
MRAADAITVARIALIVPIVYSVLLKLNPVIPISLLAISIASDALDGFAALHSVSKGSVSFIEYMKYSFGDKSDAKRISELKSSVGKTAKFGPRMDVAGDRITEYSLWALFIYTHVVPLFVLLIIIMRHSIADALMGAKGTSSKMKTRFARLVYSSNLIGRAGVNVMKFVTFAYLMLVYVSGYPIMIGYALVAVLVLYILARGAAEIWESLA